MVDIKLALEKIRESINPTPTKEVSFKELKPDATSPPDMDDTRPPGVRKNNG